MKKLLLLFTLMLLNLASYGQQYVEVLPAMVGSTSGNGRAPQGGANFRYTRTCFVISPAEMAASGFPTATAVSALSFKYLTAQDIATTGTLKIYIQNTTDATYLKTDNTWATLSSTMTLVHSGTNTIPAATGFWDITFSGGTPFVYTGSGVYVAFEYENAIDPIAATVNVAECNTSMPNGLRNIFSPTAQGANLTNMSNWRPATRFAFTASCLSPSAVVASNVTTNSATIAFTAPTPAPASGYEYFLSTSTTAPSAASVATATVTGTTISLTSLLPTSSYSIWIRSVCSANSKSVWTAATTILTDAVVPFQEGFENPLLPGLTIFNAGVAPNAGNNWGVGSAVGFAATGTTYAQYNFNATNAANAWLFTRPIQLAAATQYTVSFKVRAREDGTPPVIYAESMKATIGTTNTVAAQSNILWDSGLNGINYTTYTTQSGTFTPATSGRYNIGFHCYSIADRFQLLLDDISITATLSISQNELTADDVTLFPVPVYDNFNIKFDNSLLAEDNVSLIDLNGRTVRVFDKQVDNYNISDLSPGVYMVKIKSAENVVYKKIIKN